MFENNTNSTNENEALKEMNQSQTRNKEVLINSERNDSFK